MTGGQAIEIADLSVRLGGQRRLLAPRSPVVRAVDGVSLAIAAGEMLGLVGESGCGKTTFARTLVGLQRETSGEIRLDGALVSGLAPRRARAVRRTVQYVWQDSAAALDPWWRVGSTLDESLRAVGGHDAPARRSIIDETLAAVGLDPALARRYPHELSGGQLRRIGIARALVLRPRVLVLDEPTAGLDLSVQATILALIADLRARLGLTCVFISHDLSVVRAACERVAIMYLGRIVEQAPTASLFAQPLHPYTKALLEAAPHLDSAGDLAPPALDGDPPSAIDLPPGCRFAPRCAAARDACRASEPALALAAENHRIACHRWHELQGATSP